MKLWQKTSLICIVVIVAVVCVCSGVLLVYSKNTVLELTYAQAQAKQRDLATSFSEMLGYYLSDTDSETVKISLVNYCFSRFADSSSVLVQGEDILYSSVSISPVDNLTLTGGIQQQYEGEIQDRDILIVGSLATAANESYAVYVVEDISTVYNSIANIIWTFILVSLGGIVLGAIIVILLMRRSTRPLLTLASSARRIAGGEYAMRSNVRLSDEIGALSADFDTMAEAVQTHIAQLTETAERQRLFIGGVTHEYKTPLTTLMLHAHMLRSANMTEDERDNSLEHIETQCAWLERLTQTLLKLITLEQSIEVSEFSVSELFEQVRSSTLKALSDRSVSLILRCGTSTLPLNADLMQSLLVNLVDNASKAYDPDAPNRNVYLSAYDNVIEVRDEGRGIPQEEIARITEPFYMVDKSRSKKNGGSGLGLALVKRIADAHGARLEIESTLGKGTTARISFP